MKTRILAFTLLLATLLLAACGGTAGSTPASTSAPASTPQSGTVQGTVVDATMNTITIQAPNGSEYTFGTEGAEVNAPDGILIGDTVTLHYTGAFDDTTQLQSATVTSISVDEEGENHSSQPASTGDVQSIQGTIEQYDGGGTMMIVDATGVDFLFSLEGADLHVGDEGFQVGDVVIIYYYGELVDKPEVQDVTVGEVKKADQ